MAPAGPAADQDIHPWASALLCLITWQQSHISKFYLLYVCRFCWPCITQWSDRETRCPLCKQRFQTIKRKAVYFGDPHAKRRKLNSGEAAEKSAVDAADGSQSPSAATASAADRTDGAEPPGSPPDSSSCPESPKGRLEGVVLETKRVQQRDQVRGAVSITLEPSLDVLA